METCTPAQQDHLATQRLGRPATVDERSAPPNGLIRIQPGRLIGSGLEERPAGTAGV